MQTMAPTSNFSPLMGQFACLQATMLSAVQSLWGRGCSCARCKSQVFMSCGSQLSWVPGKMSAIRCGNASIHLSKTGQQFLARNCTVHQSAMVHASAVILASRKYMHCCRWTLTQSFQLSLTLSPIGTSCSTSYFWPVAANVWIGVWASWGAATDSWEQWAGLSGCKAVIQQALEVLGKRGCAPRKRVLLVCSKLKGHGRNYFSWIVTGRFSRLKFC